MPHFTAYFRVRFLRYHFGCIFKKSDRISLQTGRMGNNAAGFRNFLSAAGNIRCRRRKNICSFAEIFRITGHQQFSGVHIMESRRKPIAIATVFVKNSQITLCMTVFRKMRNDNIAVINNRFQSDRLMDRFLPYKLPQTFKKFRAIFLIKIVYCMKTKLSSVFHLNDFHFGQKSSL